MTIAAPTSAINLALDWLTDSKVRVVAPQQAPNGGYYQGYDWQAHSYTFVYSKVSGYAISLLLNAYRWKQDEAYLTAAQDAARFILKTQNHSATYDQQGAVPQGLKDDEYRILPKFNSFDTAVCLQGLLDLYTWKKHPKMLEACLEMGNWLLNMQFEDGAFQAAYSPDAEKAEQIDSSLHHPRGSLHAKHAISLFKLYQYTEDQRFESAALNVCDWVLNLQHRNGSFRVAEHTPWIDTHTHCLATEGLLYAYFITKAERYREAARRAGDWLLKAQNRDGSLSMTYKKRIWHKGGHFPDTLFPKHITDATAQAIRIWLILYCRYGKARYLNASRKAGGFLLRMQCTQADDSNKIGGFYYASGHPVIYTCSTQFATAALFGLHNVYRTDNYRSMMEELF
ncbi:MAG: terpene cyclase/mutase family protein [Anaerolineales bacterium]|nr:terpene cyclase/mutase family protein [Anaerolineales bacterium]